MDVRAVEAAYDTWASTYDTDANLTCDLDAEVLRMQPLPLADASIVELGCGTGKNTRWLAEHARRVAAIDFSERMLARARRRVVSDRVRFVRGNIIDVWPVPDGSIDLVIGNLVLEHIPDLRPVFHEAARVLRPGGRLFVCELHPYRQMLGSQARFVNPSTGTELRIAAFPHDVADFVNGGIDAGLRVVHLGEWRHPAAEPPAVPRLLSVTYAKE